MYSFINRILFQTSVHVILLLLMDAMIQTQNMSVSFFTYDISVLFFADC